VYAHEAHRVEGATLAGVVGVVLCALLAMGVYIAFEMLDLDGSSLRQAWAGSAVAAEAAGGETDRFLPPTVTPPHTPVLGWTVEPVGLEPESGALRGPAPMPRLGTWRSRLLPRTNLARETSSTTSPSADPA
jgi:hypothetical protein